MKALKNYTSYRTYVLSCCLMIAFAVASLFNRVEAQSLQVTNDGVNDSFLEIAWVLPASCFDDGNGLSYPDGVYLELLADGEFVFGTVIDTENPEQNENSFQHFIGPNQTRSYTLNLYVQGPGDLIALCSSLTTPSASTDNFQKPTAVTATADFVDRIEVSWINNSQLSTNYFVVRKDAEGNEVIRGVVAGTLEDGAMVTFTDAFDFIDENSLINGQSYEYCIRTFSVLADSIFDEDAHTNICATGAATFDIDLNASQNEFAGKVELEWNDVSAFAEQLIIQRNGATLSTLNPDETTFTDILPVYGFESTYSVILVQSGLNIVQDTAIGSVEPIGLINGYVRNSDGIGISGIIIDYTVSIFDVEYTGSDTTDFTGFYEFKDVFFGIDSDFSLSLSTDRENVQFPEQVRIVNLRNAIPSRVEDFEVDITLLESDRTLEITSFTPTAGVDTVAFAYNLNTNADTVYLQLFREGTLIDLTDNAAGSFGILSDRGGKARENYRYSLLAYTVKEDSAKFVIEDAIIEYPDVEAPTNTSFNTSFSTSTMGAVTLTWDHISDNFAEFRIYRDSAVIARIDTSSRDYTDFEGEPGATYDYGITAVRNINGEIFESELVTSGILAIMYPEFPVISNVAAAASDSENAINISWTFVGSSADEDNYTGVKILRDGKEIDEVLRGAPQEYQDLFGEPDVAYVYSVAPFVENIDSTFMGPAVAAASTTYPGLDAPTGLTLTTGDCRIDVEWDESYNLSSFSNFDGFIIIVDGVAVDTVAPHVSAYTYYTISNASQSITVAAYREVGGTIFQTAAAAASETATIGVSVLEQINNLTVSDDVSRHVALVWDYPVYKFSQYIIKRDGILLDTLPKGARGYYDYTAEAGVEYEYSVQTTYTDFETDLTTVSKEVYGKGVRKNKTQIFGQILSVFGNGVSTDSLEVLLLNGDTTMTRTFTGDAGFFKFEDLPPVKNQNDLKIKLNQRKHSINVVDSIIDISTAPLVDTTISIILIDSFEISAFPPRPIADSLAILTGIDVVPLENSYGVAVSWNVNDGRFDGLDLFKAIAPLATITPQDDTIQYYIDTTSKGGLEIDYVYSPFFIDENEETVNDGNEDNRDRLFSITYPGLDPVENFTISPGYLGNDNTLVLGWSHSCDEAVDFYQIRRNNEIIGTVVSGDSLFFEDRTGIPDNLYTYGITAFKVLDNDLEESDEVEQDFRYPFVEDPFDFEATPLQDSNAIVLTWKYNGFLTDGFRIFRDNELLVSIESDTARTFKDFTGLPDTMHTYRVVAIVNKGDVTYQSVGSLADATFPQLKAPFSLDITPNTEKGLMDILWVYDAPGVDSFEIEYTVIPDPPLSPETLMFGIPFSDVEDDIFSTEDRFGPAGVDIQYMIYAVSNREGVRYRSAAALDTETYPDPPQPMNVTASQGTFDNFVLVEWETPFDANVDEFQLIIDGDFANPITLTSGTRRYRHIINEVGNSASTTHNYQVQAFRFAFGQSRPSTISATAVGWAKIDRELLSKFEEGGLGQLGFSVAVDGNNAVAGAPTTNISSTQQGTIISFNYNTTTLEWEKAKEITPAVNVKELGYDVDVTNGFALVGAPGSGGNSDIGSTIVYKNLFNGSAVTSVTNSPSTLLSSALPGGRIDFTDTRFGNDVALAFGSSSFYIGYTNTDGSFQEFNSSDVQTAFNGAFDRLLHLKIGTGPTSDITEEQPLTNVISVAASSEYVAAGFDGFIQVHEKDDDNGFSSSFIRVPTSSPSALGVGEYGASVAITATHLVVGAPDANGGGAIYVYKRRNNTYEELEVVELPNVLVSADENADFGQSIAIDDKFIIVGAPNHVDPAGSSETRGLAFLFEINGDEVEFVDYLSAPDAAVGDGFGTDVDITDSHITVGAPFKNSNAGAVYFYSINLIEEWERRVTNVQASDGDPAGQVSITWSFDGNTDYIDGFAIYRDDIKIGESSATSTSFFDNSGVAGRIYTYQVKVFVNGVEAQGLADTGFRLGDGEIKGTVVTATGQAPVEGVAVTATGVVEGEVYTYSDTTNNSGFFFMPNVFVGDSLAAYSVSVEFEDHVFLDDTLEANLTQEGRVVALQFVDLTAYAISGTVAYENVLCGLDSIQVEAISIFEDNSTTTKSAFTDANGIYSLIVDPTLEDLKEIKVRISNTSERTNIAAQTSEFIRHQFRPDGDTSFTVLDTFPQFVELNFDDTLKYEVELFITTVCGGAASDGNFSIEVGTKDGCYAERFETFTNGVALADIPPLDDLFITVKGVEQNTIQNLLVVDYLKFRPDTLNLRKLHVANFVDTFTTFQVGEFADRNLVYHRPANLTVNNPFSRRFCGDQSVGILDQEEFVTLDFNVSEEISGLTCNVNEGYIIVNNSAAKQNRVDTLDYNEDTGLFTPHVFRAGTPNIVFPYRKGIDVRYYSAKGDLLAQIIVPVIILGTDLLSGSDIIIDITDTEGQVKLPAFILRDPPGDQSFASLTEGTTIEKTYSQSNAFSGYAGVVSNFKGAFFKAGAFLDFTLDAGGGEDKQSTYGLKTTVKQTVSTSSSARFTGENADIIGGFGSAIAYSLSEILVYKDSADVCELNKVQGLEVGIDGIKTQFQFTVGQIKELVEQLRSDSLEAERGNLAIYRNRDTLDRDEVREFLGNKIANWELVLNYHAVESVPYVAFCKDPLNTDSLFREKVAQGWFVNILGTPVISNDAGLTGLIDRNDLFIALNSPDDLSDSEKRLIRIGAPKSWKNRVSKARSEQKAFCEQIGTGEGSSFVPNENITWTNELIADYEKAVSAVALYTDSLQIINNSDVESKVGDLSGSSSAYLPQSENYTFSGGADLTITETSNQRRSTVHKQDILVDLQLAAGFWAKVKESFLFGFLGSGTVTNAADSEFRAGVRGRFTWKSNETRVFTKDEENGTAFRLSDNDPGDQFSVSVFKPVLQGHGPYFELLGGRSSCPPEANTIYRDRFFMSVYDTATQSTFDRFVYENLSVGEPLTLYLQISNENPFGESRDVYIYQDAASNINGASVTIDGRKISGGNRSGGIELTNLPANEPFLLPIQLTRVQDAYEYEDILIIMRPGCADGDRFMNRPDDGTIEPDTVIISAFFDSPCTDITLGSPSDDWLITRRDASLPDDREDIVVEVLDYDPDNALLEEIIIQYRRIGQGGGWTTISPLEVVAPEEGTVPGYDYPISKDSLQVYNSENFAADQVPKLFFTWDITDDFADDDINYADGTYEIRAQAKCGTSGVVSSNAARGRIIRNSGGVFAQIQPSDGVYTRGDEISVVVNKPLNCSDVSSTTNVFTVTRKSDGAVVPGTVACFDNLDKLIFQPDDENLSTYDGDTLVATISNILDEAGIVYDTTFTKEFFVQTGTVFLQDQEINVTVYQDDIVTLSTRIFPNSPANIEYDLSTSDASFLLPDPFPANNIFLSSASAGDVLNFILDASVLSVGDTTATITVTATSLSDVTVRNLTFNITVLATPPYWFVDGSQFSSSMFVIANYRFEDDMSTSVDTMDQIAVFIDNEIRGVGKIQATDRDQFVAFVTVFGDGTDDGKALEFRVWDATPGLEYNAYPYDDSDNLDTIFYSDLSKVGSFTNPEILVIDPDEDLARNIPINGGGSWTFFSVNSQEEDMRVSNVLRELIFAQDGDILITNGGATASYNSITGQWIGNGLDTIFPELGYRIYLGGPNDTIRITGENATYGPIDLFQGFSLIGYPLQDTMDINTVLAPGATGFTGLTDGDFIFTRAQDPTLPGLSSNMFGEFNGSQWIAVGGMGQLRPFFGYQVSIQGTFARLLYPGATASLTANDKPAGYQLDRQEVVANQERAKLARADLPFTWAVDPAKYPSSMFIIGQIEIDGNISIDENDRVAAFINGESRGFGELKLMKGWDKYYVFLQIHGDIEGEEVDIRIFDADTKQLYFHTDRLAFEPNKVMGRYGDPFMFRNKTFQLGYDVQQALCAEDQAAVATVTSVEGMTGELQYKWSNGEETATAKALTVGKHRVTITDESGYWTIGEVEIENSHQTIPSPSVELMDKTIVCANDDVRLSAKVVAQNNMNFNWYNGRGKLIHKGTEFMINEIQRTEDIYVESNLNGCASERIHYTLQVNEPFATYNITPQTDEVELGDELSFELTQVNDQYTYKWDMGDGTSVKGAKAKHIYDEEGLYFAKLIVSDQDGCTSVIPAPMPVQVVNSTFGLMESFTLEAKVTPNPFAAQFMLTLNVGQEGRYNLRLRDAQGRLIWNDKMDLAIGQFDLNLDGQELKLADGVYFMEVEFEQGGKKILKLLKAKP